MKSLESTSNRVSTLHIQLSAENTQVVLAGDNTDKHCACCREIKEKCEKKNTETDDVTDDPTEAVTAPETLEDVALKSEETEEQQQTPETSQTVNDDVTDKPEAPETVTETPSESPPPLEQRPVYTVDTQKLVEAIQRQKSKKKRKRKKSN